MLQGKGEVHNYLLLHRRVLHRRVLHRRVLHRRTSHGCAVKTAEEDARKAVQEARTLREQLRQVGGPVPCTSEPCSALTHLGSVPTWNPLPPSPSR
jgi:hypothetical protein